MPPDIQSEDDMSLKYEYEGSSDGASSDVDDTHDDDSWSPLDDIKRSKTFPLGLRGDYTVWSPQAAFRELVQNWYGRP